MNKFFVFFVFLSFTHSSYAHKYHKSSLYLNFDKAEQQLQIIVEANTHDIQNVLNLSLGGNTRFRLEDLQSGSYVEEALVYFRSNLVFEFSGEILDYDWFDIEIKSKITKIYLAADLPDDFVGPEGIKITDTLLFKYNHNQMNYIYVEGQGHSYVTSLDRNIKTIILK
jgi:hypothetical protein